MVGDVVTGDWVELYVHTTFGLRNAQGLLFEGTSHIVKVGNADGVEDGSKVISLTRLKKGVESGHLEILSISKRLGGLTDLNETEDTDGSI